MKRVKRKPESPRVTSRGERISLLSLDLERALQWFIDSVQLSGEGLGLPRMTTAQSMLLGYIVTGEHRPARLARSMGMSRQAISVLIARFVRAGVLVTNRDPKDARAVLVDFAPGHIEKKDAVRSILRELERRCGEIVGADRLAVMRAALTMDWGPPIKLDITTLSIAAPIHARRRS